MGHTIATTAVTAPPSLFLRSDATKSFLLSDRISCMVHASADAVATLVLSEYSKLDFRPPDGQFTILAGFVLQNSEELKLISLGTGSKCLPAARLPEAGDALHDSHAEVLARRGAVRWFLEEIARSCTAPEPASSWICRQGDGKYALNTGTTLNMYISTVPCMPFVVPCPSSICLTHHRGPRRRCFYSVPGVIPRPTDGRAEGLLTVCCARAKHRLQRS